MSKTLYTARDWREHLRIFRAYGYNPYDSVDTDVGYWWNVPAKLGEERVT